MTRADHLHPPTPQGIVSFSNGRSQQLGRTILAMDDLDLMGSHVSRPLDPCSTAAPVVEDHWAYLPESTRFTMCRASRHLAGSAGDRAMQAVADGVVWRDGTVSVYWRGTHRSQVQWRSMLDARTVHHGNTNTEFVLHDGTATPPAELVTPTRRLSLFRRQPDLNYSTLVAEAVQWEDETLALRGTLWPCWQVWERWQPMWKHWNSTIRDNMLTVVLHDSDAATPSVSIPHPR